MKKLYPLLLLFLFSNLCHAQNYQCIQSGVKHYFINDTNYLRGISIDSIKTTGDTVIYYPYRTMRTYPAFNDTGGSWLGEHVMQLPDGTFLFDDLWGDTVSIKTLANVGDSWLFYNDTINRTYIATLMSTDTMTVLGVMDSVKVITINAYHGGVPDTTDSVNNFNIILSKNNGFAKIFDLYTFPYYAPSASTVWNDQYLSYVGINNSIFNIVAYHNPTSLEMYNFNVGDMFAGYFNTTTDCPDIDYILNYTYYDSIIYKTVIDTFHINYAIHHLINGSETNIAGGGPYYENYIDTLYTDTSLVFLTQMPEEYTVAQLAYFFYPSDTSFCHLSPAYLSVNPWIFESCSYKEAEFKQGFLPIYDTPICSAAAACWASFIGFTNISTDVIFYALVNDSSCSNIILPPLNVPKTATPLSINIFPNPAHDELDILASYLIQKVSVTNILGQTMYNGYSGSEFVHLDVSEFPPGVYFVKVNNTEVRKFVKE